MQCSPGDSFLSPWGERGGFPPFPIDITVKDFTQFLTWVTEAVEGQVFHVEAHETLIEELAYEGTNASHTTVILTIRSKPLKD